MISASMHPEIRIWEQGLAGVHQRGRNSDNKLIREKLGWAPERPLRDGLEKTYAPISQQVDCARSMKNEAPVSIGFK
jgi:nucleoside-diphosphate-sugar epimerase